MPECDVLIIGSGPAGVHAAFPLVEVGKNVTMIDGGRRPPSIGAAPDRNFEDVRRSDADQSKWFLGEDLSGIPLSGLTGGLGGGQVSGNRSYVTADTDKLPMKLTNALVIQSLAQGGLGAAWGATCAYLKPEELTAMGLPAGEMERHYETITRRIGISGRDEKPGMQRNWTTDLHGTELLHAYDRKRSSFDKQKLAVRQPAAAVLTEPKDGREATTYNDMDYWADPGRSVYRPQYTLDQLKGKTNFTYIGDAIVDTVSEKDGEAHVAWRTTDGKTGGASAKKIILCAGAVNTARILLRSLGLFGTPTPFLGKPHVFTACLHLRTLGKTGPKERLSLCQVLLTDEESRSGLRAGSAQLYSYRSLQLFRMLSALPFAAPEALGILSMLTPSLVIADIRFPALRLPGNTLTLHRTAGGDHVHIGMTLEDHDRAARLHSLGRLKKGMRALGLLPLRTMWLPEASTTHYAGTVPATDDQTLPLTSDAHGKIRGFAHVFAADGSVFRSLPPLPHTLTLMANANRIGEKVLQSLG